jgi:hypothetical protein
MGKPFNGVVTDIRDSTPVTTRYLDLEKEAHALLARE